MDVLISIYIFIIGMLLSSFFGVIAMRIPNKESLMGRSYCPKCHHQLRFIDVLPLVGYFINKGRCRDCKETIPIIYLVIEVIGGLLFLGAYLLYGFTLSFVIAVILISVLMIESISDFEQMIVIDRIWMIGIIPLIVIHIIQKNILTHLLSSLILFAILYSISYIGSKVYKKEALGGGDVKLYIFIGFVLTWQQGLLSLFLASFFGLIFGLIFKKQNKLMPLVPFIALGVMISFVFGHQMIDWYINLLRM
ncbi:MAG: prepilin peptidase [Bacillota bacterium]|nr:MAG: prepilin peptidase [Bacillota bacterium]